MASPLSRVNISCHCQCSYIWSRNSLSWTHLGGIYGIEVSHKFPPDGDLKPQPLTYQFRTQTIRLQPPPLDYSHPHSLENQTAPQHTIIVQSQKAFQLTSNSCIVSSVILQKSRIYKHYLHRHKSKSEIIRQSHQKPYKMLTFGWRLPLTHVLTFDPVNFTTLTLQLQTHQLGPFKLSTMAQPILTYPTLNQDWKPAFWKPVSKWKPGTCDTYTPSGLVKCKNKW